METVTLTAEECTWPGTTAEGLASLRPVIDGGVLTAGNASRRSDRAAACVVVDATEVERRGIDPLALYRSFTGLGLSLTRWATARCSPFPAARPLGLSIDDIDPWEHHEAFLVQVAYCRDRLGIAHERLNVNGDTIAVGHPDGMSGTRLTCHPLIEGPVAARNTCENVGRWRHGCARLFKVL